jgi:hypothetical protein
MAAAGLTEPAAPRNAVSPWEAGAPRSAASRWEAAANPWLGAHRTVLAYWKSESISLQQRVRCEPASLGLALSLLLGHTAVEIAEGKALLTKRFCSKSDECYPVQLLPPVLTVGCALQPDGYAPQRRTNAPLREHRHTPEPDRQQLAALFGHLVGVGLDAPYLSRPRR